MSWLEAPPLAVVGVVSLAAMLAAFEGGHRGRRWLRRKVDQGIDEPDGQEFLLSAALGLLALLLGFTFSLALNRYEDRRQLVVAEANAIDTTWLRTQLLQDPNRSAMNALLRQYLDARLAWSETDHSTAGLGPTNALQEKLWSVTSAAIRSEQSDALSRSVMESMNQTFDIASARAAAGSAHIPDRVLQVLFLYAVLSAAMLGYAPGGSGKPHRVATALVLVLLTLALVVILDLDRPRSGAIQVSEQPLEDLRGAWRSLPSPAASAATSLVPAATP